MHAKKTKSALALGTGVLILLSIAMASLIPLYPDEVAYKVFLEGFISNGGIKQSVTPFCLSGFTYKPSLLLQPAAYFWSLLTATGEGWSSYRFIPLSLLIALPGLALWHAYRAGSTWAIPIVSLVAVGPGIYGLLILRPEVYIIALSLLILYSTNLVDAKKEWRIAIAAMMLTVFSFSLICYLHPKGLYMLPFALSTLWYLSLKSIAGIRGKLILGTLSLATILIAHSALTMHSIQYLTCKEVNPIHIAMNSQSLNLSNLLLAPWATIKDFARLFSNPLFSRGLHQLGYNIPPDIGYLPTPENSMPAKIVNLLVISSLLTAFLFCISESLRSLKRAECISGEKALIKILWFLGLIIPYFVSLSKNWYDAAGFTGAICAAAYTYGTSNIATRRVKLLGALALAGSSVSVLFVATMHLPAFTGGYSGPGIPFNRSRFDVLHIAKVLISDKEVKGQESLIVDDYTYDAAKHRKSVLPLTYLRMIENNPLLLKHTIEHHKAYYGIVVNPSISFLSSFDFKVLRSARVGNTDKYVCLIKYIP